MLPPNHFPAADASVRAGTPIADVNAGPVLVLLVEDATGGAIGGARIAFDDQQRGVTDAAGSLSLLASTLPHTGTLAIGAVGYVPVEADFVSPGQLRVQLLPGNQIAGVVVESGTGRPVADIQVETQGSQTLSDREGRFVLRDLPAGFARVEARGDHHMGTLPDPIALGFGTVVTDVRIEVRPAFAIRGRVMAGNEPVHGSVSVEGCGSEAVVADDGNYAMVGVSPGRCGLSLRGKGHSAFFTLPDAIAVELVDRDITQNIEVGVRHGLTVALVDQRGQAVAGRTIKAQQSTGRMMVAYPCDTKVDGRCSFFGFSSGEVILEPENSGRKHKVAVPAPGMVKLVVEDTGAVTGRLTSADGHPPSRRRVQIRGGKGVHVRTISAADGSFGFAHLPSDHYEVAVCNSASLCREAPAEATAQISLGVGEQRSNVVIELAPDDGRITGRVVDAHERPLADVLVAIDLANPGVKMEDTRIGGLSVQVTRPDGTFAFEHLARVPRYSLRAHHPDGRQARNPDLPIGSAVIMHIAEVARLDVVVRRADGRPAEWGTVEVLEGDRVVDNRFLYDPSQTVHFDSLTPGRRKVRSGSVEVAVDLVPGRPAKVILEVP